MRTIPAFFFLAAFGLVLSCTKPESVPQAAQSGELINLTRYVDPFIGSGFHGHVFVGANVPFGAVQLGPSQISEGWDWCSGYHYSDSVIIGFAHTHLSGTGIGDLGDISVMPVTGDVKLTKGKPGDLAGGYGSIFSHQQEKATPGYYAVTLQRYGIEAELTASKRVGFHRYTFPAAQPAHLVIDLEEGIGWDQATETHIEKINDSTLTGYRYSKGWADDQRIFFALIVSAPVTEFRVAEDQAFIAGESATGKKTKGVLSIAATDGNPVLVKVGISPVSTQNALLNIQHEIPHWDFDQVATQAEEAWNHELNKVQIETDSDTRMRTFYTALYHTMIAPSVFNDVNGEYRGTDKKVYHDTSFTNHTTFSLWDTYRATHSLYTLLQPGRVDDMVNSMLKIYEQQGKLPVWHLMGNETNTMPGNSAFPVIADAYLKGFSKFDPSLALDAMKASALKDDRGLNHVKALGYIPCDAEVESVAKGLEYSFDEWCAAQVAKKLGREEDFEFFSKRAQNYRYYFDPETRFMRGRASADKWRTPFDPLVSRHRRDDYSEGNAWQYTWLVPHDVEGLITLLGGEKPFLDKLDSLFIIQGNMGEEASNDITGLIGQYAHGNEPSHHITYLYGYAGQPWKTAEKVRYILDSLYSDRPDGLSGNEDVGQMSSWYIFSALGFYPANPANGAYVFGSPVVNKATIQVGEGKTFTIQVKNNSPKNIYIKRLTLNGQPYTKAYLRHEEIVKGGELVIEMDKEPGKEWGVEVKDRAKSMVE